MKKNETFMVCLDSNKIHSGLNEILDYYAARQPEDRVAVLVGELSETNQRLYEALHVVKVKHNARAEAGNLIRRVVSMQRYVDSCRYVADATVKASADFLYGLITSFDKSIVMMKSDIRNGAVSTLLRDLATTEALGHVAHLQEMASRIAGLQTAFDALMSRLVEVDQANSTTATTAPLLELKRTAAAKVLSLTDYLRVMSEMQPEQYADDYRMVSEVIDRLNATHKVGKKADLAEQEQLVPA